MTYMSQGAEKIERSRKQYKFPCRANFRNRNWSRDSSRDSQDRDRRPTRRYGIDLETSLKIQVTD